MTAPSVMPQSAPKGAKDRGRELKWLRGLKLLQRAAVDLFAGPGGWDVAAELLGIDVVGVEWDGAACDTRRAVGHRTVEADVAGVDPLALIEEHWPGARPAGLIASPPCQTFSSAGGGAGREMLDELCAVARHRFGAEGVQLAAAELKLADADPRSLLVLEPIRWIKALEPRWIALEQVPSVLPIWEAYAEGLRAMGYSVWTGVLSAERYGVPQTRKRAILVASLDREVAEPPATHKRYVAPRKDRDDMDTLFGDDTPERGRITAPGDEHLKDWVSMAEALGWSEGTSPAPAPTVTSCTGSDVWGGSGGRARAEAAAVPVTLVATQQNGATGEPGERNSDEPAFTVTGNADRWRFRQSNQKNATTRALDEPAPTVMFGHRANEVVWEPVPVAYDVRQTGGDGTPVAPRPVTEPAPTITSSGVGKGRDVWVFDRPSTAVMGDARIAPPGYRGGKAEYERGDEPDSMFTAKGDAPAAIRVTEEQAACLQSFPAGYPWQGTKSKRFEQIGNAVPPGLARPVLLVAAPIKEVA